MPPAVVRFTEALGHDVRHTIRLSGTVESPTSSMVATEVAGPVRELRAREGTAVRKGEVLAVLSSTNLNLQLRAVEAQLKEARARLQLAESNLDRAKELFASDVVSRQQLDDAFSEFTAWQGRAEALAAQEERIETDLHRCSVRAPFGGVVVGEQADVGEWLAVGAPVVELLSLEYLDIRVQVPEKFFSDLMHGVEVAVRFDALPDLEIQGAVSAIIPRADPQARTFPVKVRIANGEGRIGVGMLAEVSLPVGVSYRATVIPKDALLILGEENYVFVLNGDDTVHRAAVESGDGVGTWIVVRGDIQPGQRVITRGNERLQEGQAVAGEHLEYTLP
jgi:RND family efflux transporter MFP subunit